MKKEQLRRVVQPAAMWVFLAMLCLFSGCVASYVSLGAVVGKDHTQVETVGVIYQKGFPIWYHTYAAGGRVFGDFHPIRLVANWGVWAAAFMLICYGLRRLFMKVPVWVHLVGILLLLFPLAWQMSLLCVFLEGAIKEHREKVRAEAIGKLNDKAFLAEIMESEEAIIVRHAASKQLYMIRSQEIRDIGDQALLAEIAQNDPDGMIRKEAVSRLTDQTVLAELAIRDEDYRVRVVAIEKLNGQVTLQEIANNDKNDYVRSIARKRLQELKHRSHRE